MPLTSLSAAGFPHSAGWCCLKGNWEKAKYCFEIWKTVQIPYCLLLQTEMICWADRLNSWKKKESLPLRELQLMEHMDQWLGWEGWGWAVLLVALPAAQSTLCPKSSGDFFENVCTWREKAWKKAFSCLCSTLHFFNHTRVCFNTQPASSALPCSPTHSRDSLLSCHDLCSQARLKAFTPLLVKPANELQIAKIFMKLFPTFVSRNVDLIIHL